MTAVVEEGQVSTDVQLGQECILKNVAAAKFTTAIATFEVKHDACRRKQGFKKFKQSLLLSFFVETKHLVNFRLNLSQQVSLEVDLIIVHTLGDDIHEPVLELFRQVIISFDQVFGLIVLILYINFTLNFRVAVIIFTVVTFPVSLIGMLSLSSSFSSSKGDGT